MKITLPLLKTQYGLQFRTHWIIKSKVKVSKTTALEEAAAFGIEVVDPNILLHPALQEEHFEPPPPEIRKENTPAFVFHRKTLLIEKLRQAQHLTNSIAFGNLPKAIQDKISEPAQDDVTLMSNTILKSSLLNARQDKLPKILDVVNQPGYKPRRKYGSKPPHIVQSIIYSLLCENNTCDEERIIVQAPFVTASVAHSGNLMHFRYPTSSMVFSLKPLRPFLTLEERKLYDSEALPDISPFSPFVNVNISTTSSLKEGYSDKTGVNIRLGETFAPHTAVICYASIKDPYSEVDFGSRALLHCFASAAIYAKSQETGANCDLKNPVTINLIHTTGRFIQFCCFQLNTLNLTGPTKNFFWYHPWDTLYSSLCFTNAMPTIEGVNAKPLSVLRALL